jgi:hypothetical protein
MIKVKDIALHTPSGLYYRCENTKMERWMNMNGFYEKIKPGVHLPKTYFLKY